MILIDDQPYARPCPSNRTVRELAQEVCTGPNGSNRRIVIAILRDGQAIDDRDLQQILDAPAGEMGRLELLTQPVQAVVRTVLEQAGNELAASRDRCERAAELLDRGDQQRAMTEIQQLLDLWKQTQRSLVLSAEALDLRLDDLAGGGCRFTELIETMKSQLTELREVIKTGDHVLISDLLRYGLEATSEKWQGLLSGMMESLDEC